MLVDSGQAPGPLSYAEPLLGPIDALDPTSIDPPITGGESASGYRAMQVQWVRPSSSSGGAVQGRNRVGLSGH
jgi:protein gp37